MRIDSFCLQLHPFVSRWQNGNSNVTIRFEIGGGGVVTKFSIGGGIVSVGSTGTVSGVQ